MWNEYHSPVSLDHALALLDRHQGRARVVAGATDLMLELERGVRTGVEVLVDLTRVPGLDQIQRKSDGWLEIGPLVTHNACVASKLLNELAWPLPRACWEVGAPQIRNRGTVAGNLITASPANDTIPALMVLDTELRLRSAHGERSVRLAEFYSGVRRTVMAPNEILVAIRFRTLQKSDRGGYIKHALRAAQAISVVNAACVVQCDGTGMVSSARIALGAVAPVVIRAAKAEAALIGRVMDEDTIRAAARAAAEDAHPIDDVRGSAQFRRVMVKHAVAGLLREAALGGEARPRPESPPLLWGRARPMGGVLEQPQRHAETEPIQTRVNGREVSVTGANHKSLLRLLREDLRMIGTKEGCAEGECGACTVFLDGVAVMACLVPAPRAHGAEVVTVEGLAVDGSLHPVQQAFVEAGAVQCGYCTPGFVMSAVKLLEENPRPSRDEAAYAIAGNLCRCTGYYKILDAIERAAHGAGGSA
jgi:xanthine dehydrogenase iron-sulfur cluster and FAD-binding subunit A